MKDIIIVLLVLSVAFISGCGDFVPPSISILSPDDQAYVSGKVGIIMDVYSDAEIMKVDVYIDGKLAATLKEAGKPGLWSWEWDTREYLTPEKYGYDYYNYDASLNMHTIYAKAEDADGDTAGTKVISVNVRDYSLEDNTYRNWRYKFQISTEGTDWGILLGGSLPGTYYYTRIYGVVSISPDAYNAYSSSTQEGAVFLISARPYLENLTAYEEMVASRLAAAYEDPYNLGRIRLEIYSRKDYEMGGTPAKEFEFRMSGGVEGKTICLVKDNIAYTIYMTVVGALEYSDYKVIFSKILNNFKLM